MSQCRGVAAFNGRYVEPVRSSVLGQERPTVKRVSSRSTFDMRGDKTAQPAWHPLDGRVRHLRAYHVRASILLC